MKAAERLLSAVHSESSPSLVVTALIGGVECKDVLVDGGAEASFVRRDWAKRSGLRIEKLDRPLHVSLADGNTSMTLKDAVRAEAVKAQGSTAPCTLNVMDRMNHQVILGLNWLKAANVTVSYGQDMLWNGKPLQQQKDGQLGDKSLPRIGRGLLPVSTDPPQQIHSPAELRVCGVEVKVGNGFEGRMQAILRDCAGAFSTELKARSAAALKGAIKCEVRLKDPNCRPVVSPERRRSEKDISTLRRCTEEMIKAGLIQPSISPWSSQAVLVKKVRDGVVLDEKRPTWDYRWVNNLVQGDAYALPLPENMFNMLKGARLFSKLDLTKGFWQIPMEEKSRLILAMATPLGLQEPGYMPFGYKNAPSVFQREMERVFRDRLGKGVFVFVDDILIYTKTEEEHEEMVRWVLGRLIANEYYAQPSKCEFFKRELSFLGHVISERGVDVQQHKVKAVQEWPTLQSKKDIKSFLGLTGYYRKFIPRYSAVAKPLSDLLKEDRKFDWGEEQRKAFDELKAALTNATFLAHPNPQEQYVLNTDASGFAVAAVLSQKQQDGKVHPVAYYSRKMLPEETRYLVSDQELLAIVAAVEHWRCYLEGAEHPVLILTDHRGLEYLSSKKELRNREARWIEKLAEIEFKIRYVPGPQNAAADALSRRADYQEQVSAERRDETEVTEERPRLKITLAPLPVAEAKEAWEARAEELPFKDELLRAAAADPAYAKKVKEAEPNDGLLRGEGLLWTVDGILHVPDDQSVRSKLLHAVHDAPTGGHLGERKTLRKLQADCYWPGMKADVEDYVHGCVTCARIKPTQQMPAGLLRPLPIPHRPWEVIGIDFVGPLPKTADHHDFILSVKDQLTKQVHFIPTTVNVTAKGTVKLLLEHVIKLHGLPSAIVSDRDVRFQSTLWKEIWKTWGSRLMMGSSYHPQTNGQTERVHRSLETDLRAFVDKKGKDGADWLPMAEVHYNNSVHEATGKTPFELNGTTWTDAYSLALSSPTMRQFRAQTAEDVLADMKRAWEDARTAMMAARDRMKRTADAHRRDVRYSVGDLVMLSTAHLAKHGTKLSDLYVGPFPVVKVSASGLSVWLLLPKEYARLQQPFHVEKLKRFVPSARGWDREQHVTPTPELVDGEVEWEVERLLGKKEAMEPVQVEPEDSPLVDAEEKKPVAVEEEEEEEKKEAPSRRVSPRLAAKAAAEGRQEVNASRKRVVKRKEELVLRYLVKWVGFSEEYCTWERASNLRLHAQGAIDDYEARAAKDRGETTVGLHYLHALVDDGDTHRLTVHTTLVGAVETAVDSEAASPDKQAWTVMERRGREAQGPSD
ncbi:MAG: RNase H-like domain-containing protein [Bryobacteraceae bacterium]